MYVLTKDNFVFYGPNLWNPTLIQSYIQDDYDLNMVISQTAPVSNTDLGNGITAYIVSEVTIPEHNPKIQKINGPFYTFSDTATQSFEILDKDVDHVKSELVAIIADNRWKKETSGVVLTIQGTNLYIPTSRGDRDIFGQALSSGYTPTEWKMYGADGQIYWLTISLEELQTIVSSIVTHISAAFTWEKTKTDEINACTTLVELDGVVLE